MKASPAVMQIFQSRIMQRALRFACSGILVTCLHALIALCFLRYIASIPVLANGVAFLLATGASWWLNTRWSFASRLQRRNLGRFLWVSIFGLSMSMLIALLSQLAGLADWQGIVAVVLVIPPLTFLLHHFWTYQ